MIKKLEKGQLVKINAKNINNKYGIVIEDDNDGVVILKVGSKRDHQEQFKRYGDRVIMLGKYWVDESKKKRNIKKSPVPSVKVRSKADRKGEDKRGKK